MDLLLNNHGDTTFCIIHDYIYFIFLNPSSFKKKNEIRKKKNQKLKYIYIQVVQLWT